MEEVFVDTNYWVALYDPSDELHQKAVLLTSQFEPQQIVTSELVLVEFLNGMSRFGQANRRLAVDVVMNLRNDSDMKIIQVTSQQFWEAVQFYGARLDKRWSLVDCSSFQIMEDRHILKALTNDRDFYQAGYRALMRDN